jgi:hypothetical protein
MANTIEILGLPQLERKLSLLEHEVFPKAAARAINRSADTVKSRTSRVIAKNMGLKLRDVSTYMKVKGASEKKNTSAELRHTGRRLNLIRFGARQTQRGVSAMPGGKRSVHPHTFMVDLGTGRFVGIRKRKGGSTAAERAGMITTTSRVGRIPVIGVVGPSVPETAATEELGRMRQDVFRERMPIEMQSALKFYVSRLK